MTVHHLKTWPQHFRAVEKGSKTFEVRKDDRDFQVADVLILQEWEPATKQYTGRELSARVGYVLRESFGVEEGHVAMSLLHVKRYDTKGRHEERRRRLFNRMRRAPTRRW